MKLYYPAVFTKSDFGYTVEFPDLPGCVTQGETLEEAFEMAEDVASGWILTSIEDGEDIPKPSEIDMLKSPSVFINFVGLDIEEYAKQYSTKSVKKTLTIPEWLNRLAEKEEINFSKELQKALKIKLGFTANVIENYVTSLQETASALASIVPIVVETFSGVNGESTYNSSITNCTVILPQSQATNIKGVTIS